MLNCRRKKDEKNVGPVLGFFVVAGHESCFRQHCLSFALAQRAMAVKLPCIDPTSGSRLSSVTPFRFTGTLMASPTTSMHGLCLTRNPPVPRMALSSGTDGSSTKTRSFSMRTGKVRMFSPPSPSSAPPSKANCFLCSGHATLLTPEASPTIPCDKTKACLCGHMFCVQCHSLRSRKLNTASCDSPYRIWAPALGGKSETWPTSTQNKNHYCFCAPIHDQFFFYLLYGGTPGENEKFTVQYSTVQYCFVITKKETKMFLSLCLTQIP